MTQQKGEQAKNLRDSFLKFDKDVQNAITYFFNLHNAAHYFYSHLPEEAQVYVNYCIQLSQEADKIEEENK